ncbi:MAG: repressor LexA [Candidatus Vogelbacteria bacterium RIFOXYD1_FULL_44_32]|uniref:Repressor LexA n=1 Tax=Candidatus Vogelbacteria bacterium RIFOXYD1_FULL_44_32 TaxID=1802438 RepID=A0A1G2QFX9_9BACT|nr:MAG: repressor LexA [Candidatus Vogelbacteria bacterium RIFOXYD1_FULL_44_32]
MVNNHKQKLVSFYERHKRMPTYTEMMKLFGYRSKNAVFKLVAKLEEAGIVAKDHLGRLLPTNSFNEVPLLGLVKAGFPSMVEEEQNDTMSLDDFLIQKKESTYILEVDGDSMIDAHIKPGDLVIAERTEQAKDGQIVIAEVDGEFTMKYFRQTGNKTWLEPANKKYKPIYPENDLKITAIVKGVIRKY